MFVGSFRRVTQSRIEIAADQTIRTFWEAPSGASQNASVIAGSVTIGHSSDLRIAQDGQAAINFSVSVGTSIEPTGVLSAVSSLATAAQLASTQSPSGERSLQSSLASSTLISALNVPSGELDSRSALASTALLVAQTEPSGERAFAGNLQAGGVTLSAVIAPSGERDAASSLQVGAISIAVLQSPSGERGGLLALSSAAGIGVLGEPSAERSFIAALQTGGIALQMWHDPSRSLDFILGIAPDTSQTLMAFSVPLVEVGRLGSLQAGVVSLSAYLSPSGEYVFPSSLNQITDTVIRTFIRPSDETGFSAKINLLAILGSFIEPPPHDARISAILPGLTIVRAMTVPATSIDGMAIFLSRTVAIIFLRDRPKDALLLHDSARGLVQIGDRPPSAIILRDMPTTPEV